MPSDSIDRLSAWADFEPPCNGLIPPILFHYSLRVACEGVWRGAREGSRVRESGAELFFWMLLLN